MSDRVKPGRPLAGAGRWFSLLALLVLPVLLSPPASAETRLMRQPDISKDKIVFVYGGDLWLVDRAGGLARKLTNDVGVEQFPMFSPDGNTIAFTAQYDGNTDLFTIPTEGGEPRRLTWHPSPDRGVAWYPDGSAILFRSVRQSFTPRFERFYKVSPDGGFAEMLSLPVAGPASFSPDGTKIAFNEPSMELRTWKRYQGGSAPDIRIYDFQKNTSEKITDWTGTDEYPMWFQDTIYFNSDRSGKLNLWAYDTKSKATRQVTKFDDFDVKFPSLGPDAIVFENGGWLYVMDLPSEKLTKIQVNVPADLVQARPEFRNVAKDVRSAWISPSAKRVVVEARGDIFTVPAKKGTYRNLTGTPGVHERNPAWSPDGKSIAYWSDASGEYEVWIGPQDGNGPARALTRGAGGYGFQLMWSPDSKKLLYSDQTGTVRLVDAQSGAISKVDKSDLGDITDYSWSPDSKWLAYSKTQPNLYNALFVYGLADGKITQVTSGLNNDQEPVFDTKGKYVYFRSDRFFNMTFGAYDNEWVFPNASGLYALALTADAPSPVKPESDEEEPKTDGAGKGDAGKGKAAGKGGAAKESAKGGGDEEKGDKGAEETPDVKIDFAGISDRVVQLPVPGGNYFNLGAGAGKLFFMANPDGFNPEDDGGGASGSLRFFDFEEREVKTVMNGVRSYQLNTDGSKILLGLAKGYAIVNAAPEQKAEDKLPIDDLTTMVDPRAEWKDMFAEAWRLERDFFYDPNMHGVDWNGIRKRYEPLVDYAAHRSDLNYLLGELIAELNCSHAYVGGGDFPNVPRVGVGLLGADYEIDKSAGRYRFKKIYRQSEWNQKVIAPLEAPGVKVNEGDYLLEVNGRPVSAEADVYAPFQNTADRPIEIRVGPRPDTTGSHRYLVNPVGSEFDLRYTDWVAGNRKKVEEASGGQVGYLHVPDTGVRGHVEFSKGFYSQVDKLGLIVDGRFNSGGMIPDEMVDRLARKPLSYWARREYRSFRTPTEAVDGPMVCLTNEYAGSGGDALPYYFRERGLGPLIGRRTWGGLVGISRDIPLLDGGRVTFPDFGFYSLDGKWAVENHGVDMDIDVDQTPELCVAGHDPQLEKGIEVILQKLKENPPRIPERPSYPIKTGVKAPGER